MLFSNTKQESESSQALTEQMLQFFLEELRHFKYQRSNLNDENRSTVTPANEPFIKKKERSSDSSGNTLFLLNIPGFLFCFLPEEDWP